MKKVEISEHGNYLFGVIDGVDFVQSGQLENGQKYGASVKLKFITKVNVIKQVLGTDVVTKKALSQVIKIPTNDNELPSLIAKYNGLIGSDLLINYSTADNHTFTVTDEKSLTVIK